MTKPLRRVQKAKLRAYFDKGTCKRCRASFVWHESGCCRRCRPVVQDELEERAATALENEKATLFFRYFLTCRKKDASDIGALARFYLRETWLHVFRGLEELASNTLPEQIDVKVLESAWEQSEAERRAAEAR